MPAVIPIAVAAIAAAGTASAAAIQSHGASAAAAAGRPSTHKFPLPKSQRAFQNYYTRVLAQNLTDVAPSFADYIKSGGTATFPMHDTGFTPNEAKNLGIVGPRGQQVPFVAPGSNQLTPEQALYLGYQISQAPGHDPNNPLARAYRLNQRIGRIEGRPQTDQRQAREQRLRTRRDRLISGGPTGGLN